MTYRYSGIDIIVGFGMCAIVFGALFLFVATTGTFLVATPPVMGEQFFSSANGMVWLQPALGQAIVERTLLQRQSDRITAQATSEWDQALLAHYSLNPFQAVHSDSSWTVRRQCLMTMPPVFRG